MPYAEDSKKDFVAEIRKDTELIKIIGGHDSDWKSIFDLFSQSNYWEGGYHTEQAEAGIYAIIFRGTDKDIKYSLAIGNI